MSIPRRPAALSLAVCLLWCSTGLPAVAQSKVRFDVERLVECLDVTTEDFAATHPGERLVEARVRVSALLQFGVDERNLEFFLAVQSPHPQIRVEDFLPRTTLATPFAGSVDVEQLRETNRNAGVTVTGTLDHFLTGSATTGWNGKQNRNLRYELLPPQQTVTASGTLHGGTGVYFKLRSAPDASLEGSREYVVVLRVPATWRGDLLLVRCEAVDLRQAPAGGASYFVALHLSGDEIARNTAQALVTAERQLRAAADQHAASIRDNAFRSRVHRWSTALALSEPQIPENWLDQVLVAPDVTRVEGYNHLPRAIRAAVQEFARQRRAILALSVSAAPGDV